MAEMRILLLNGPNLNLLGRREPEIYGTSTLADIERMVTGRATAAGAEVRAFQSNSEGEMIDWLQREAPDADGLIINAASYTHTSLALRDTISAVAIPTVEVHISNIYRREEFRHHSYISPACVGGIFGLGVHGYELAVEALLARLKGAE
jgi:3-dehydroquinate dehydratase-2